MHFIPHPYQSRAIDFLLSHPRSMLFLDMGLGKSVIALSAFAHLLDSLEACRALVVAPKSVAEATWSAEVAKWNHLAGLRVSLILGTAKQRERAIEADADLYVISRDNLVWLIKHLDRDLTRFDTLILDELSSFKNPKAQRFKAVRTVRGQFRHIYGLTGTPAPNGYLDLWAQVFCIDGGERLGQFITRYRDRYFRIENPHVTWPTYVLAPGSQATIEDKISDITLSMRASDYLTLPDRISILHTVPLDPAIHKRYTTFEREQVLQLLADQPPAAPATSPCTAPSGLPARSAAPAANAAASSILAANAAALASKLAQFANGAVYDEDKVAHVIHDAKIEALRDIIEAAHSPVLVFYAFLHDADRILLAFDPYYRVRIYHDARDLERWNAGEYDILLCHPASTAYGLNMQQGGHIIVWFGMTWNLEHYQQANARLHRQGQQHPVLIYHLVAKGTIDERAYAALARKADTQNHLLNAISELINKYTNN